MQLRMLIAPVLLAVAFSGSSCGQEQKEFGKVKVVTEEKSSGGWLGVSIQDMTSRLARSMDVKTEEGALIMDVVDNSPAEKAGLKEDDIIVEFNGKKIIDADELRNAVRKSSPGSKATVVVMRKTNRKSYSVELGKAPRAKSFSLVLPRGHRHMTIHSSTSMFGLSLMDLNRQLGEYFDTPDGRGVLVKEVEGGSTAEQRGFKAGDVIIKVGKEAIRRTDDIRWALEEHQEGDTVEVTVLRKGVQKTLTIEMEDDLLGGTWEDARSGYFRIAPHPFELDVDVDLPGDEGDATIDAEALRGTMRRLEWDLQSMGSSIREETRGIRDRVKELQIRLKEELRRVHL